MLASNNRQLLFLLGPRGKLLDGETATLQEKWRQQGFNLIFLDLLHFFGTIVATTPQISTDDFFGYVQKQVESARVKDATFDHIQQTIKKLRL